LKYQTILSGAGVFSKEKFWGLTHKTTAKFQKGTSAITEATI